jgi:xanthine permease XanP
LHLRYRVHLLGFLSQIYRCQQELPLSARAALTRMIGRPFGSKSPIRKFKVMTGSAPKRPPSLVYAVNEIPPLPVRLTLAFQHVLAMSVGWIYVVVAMNVIGGTSAQAQNLIRMSMIGSGIATILQAGMGVVGSGYLCPASCSLTYLAPSILAARTGGLSLLFGMATFAGLFTAALSRFIGRLRWMFPPDVTGLIVSIVGIQLVTLGVPRFLGYAGKGEAVPPNSVWVGVITLTVMVGFTVWGKGKLKLFPIVLALVTGFAISPIFGVMTWSQMRVQLAQPIFGVPHRPAPGMSFNLALMLPFLLMGIAATMKTVGDLTLCQKMNDLEWKRTDMKSVSGGVLANSIGTFISGLLGGIAQNTASASIGLSIATATTSRALLLPAGLMAISLAFFPFLAAIFSAMPVPVMGAVLVYTACFLVLGGLQVLTTRMLDARRILAVGIALVFGLSAEIAPDLYRGVPELLRPIFASSTALATVLVVLLNLVLRIGVKKRAGFEVVASDDNLDKIMAFMDQQGSAWGMRRDVVSRATDAIYEFVTNAGGLQLRSPKVEVTTEFDEFRLDVEIAYQGVPVELADEMPSVDDIASGKGIGALSGFIVRQYSDRVRVKQDGDICTVYLHFEH